MTTCLYPQNTPLWAYRKGCRCQRCSDVKAAKDRQRVRRPTHVCPGCGGLRWKAAEKCHNCRFAATPVDRVMARIVIDPVSECWVFTGRTTSGGYGVVGVGTSGRVAHRVTYEHFVGPVPDGLELDHTCHTEDPSCAGGDSCPHRRCVNPDHLEAVTPAENVRRSVARRPIPTHCGRGHELTSANTAISPDGKRRCRACARLRQAAFEARKKAALLREATA
jgi:hypothetical protein